MSRNSSRLVVPLTADQPVRSVGAHDEVPLILVEAPAAIDETRTTSKNEGSDVSLEPDLFDQFASCCLFGLLALLNAAARWIPETSAFLVAVVEQQEEMVIGIKDEDAGDGPHDLGRLAHCAISVSSVLRPQSDTCRVASREEHPARVVNARRASARSSVLALGGPTWKRRLRSSASSMR
jgi:hypothetical protein